MQISIIGRGAELISKESTVVEKGHCRSPLNAAEATTEVHLLLEVFLDKGSIVWRCPGRTVSGEEVLSVCSTAYLRAGVRI